LDCEPCHAETPRLSASEAAELHSGLDPAWRLEGDALCREYRFVDFAAALAFVNRVGEVAETQRHHPDIHLQGWNRIRLDISTHAIGGLSRNDFILAGHLDALEMPAACRSAPEGHRTAGIMVIGNEILSGKVTDENSPFLARELRALGVTLRRIEVIPDDPAMIGRVTARMSAAYDFVFTSGGVGPTHDDRTIEGVARGLGCGVVRNPLLVKLLEKFYGPELNEARLRMADVPEGAEVVYGGEVRIPVVFARNVMILPGVPALLRKEFLSVRSRFEAAPFFCRRAYVNLMEGDIAEILTKIEEGYHDVDVGSYPVFDEESPYRVLLTFDSKSRDSADSALERLLAQIPAESIHRVE
jgi:molybdenum cofactor synthesis domain-containing protein